MLAKFFWLAEANPKFEAIRVRLREIFERREIEVIAPRYGCVIRGKATVAKHYDLMQRILAGEA